MNEAYICCHICPRSMRNVSSDSRKACHLYTRSFFCYQWTALTATTQTITFMILRLHIEYTPFDPTNLRSQPFSSMNPILHLESIANMCFQFVCYICGRELGDDNSLVLCLNSAWTLLTTSGDHQNCPDYIPIEAGAPYLCKVCLGVNLSAAGTLLVPTNPVFDYVE